MPIGVYCRTVGSSEWTLPNRSAKDEDRCGAPDSVLPGSGVFEILGVVAEPAGDGIVCAKVVGDDAVVLGKAVAAELLRQGAGELFEGIGKH